MELSYLYVLALHIIFVVCWFAGLFYVVRLMVYYAEATQKSEPEQQVLFPQYQLMTRRLWYGITFPSAVLATGFGVALLLLNPLLVQQPWMQIKLFFVFLLWIYHWFCHKFVQQMLHDQWSKNSSFFRIWNEGATVILFSVVFLVILKNSIQWIFGTIGLVLLMVFLTAGYYLYKKIRIRSSANDKRP